MRVGVSLGSRHIGAVGISTCLLLFELRSLGLNSGIGICILDRFVGMTVNSGSRGALHQQFEIKLLLEKGFFLYIVPRSYIHLSLSNHFSEYLRYLNTL